MNFVTNVLYVVGEFLSKPQTWLLSDEIFYNVLHNKLLKNTLGTWMGQRETLGITNIL